MLNSFKQTMTIFSALFTEVFSISSLLLDDAGDAILLTAAWRSRWDWRYFVLFRRYLSSSRREVVENRVRICCVFIFIWAPNFKDQEHPNFWPNFSYYTCLQTCGKVLWHTGYSRRTPEIKRRKKQAVVRGTTNSAPADFLTRVVWANGRW